MSHVNQPSSRAICVDRIMVHVCHLQKSDVKVRGKMIQNPLTWSFRVQSPGKMGRADPKFCQAVSNNRACTVQELHHRPSSPPSKPPFILYKASQPCFGSSLLTAPLAYSMLSSLLHILLLLVCKATGFEENSFNSKPRPLNLLHYLFPFISTCLLIRRRRDPQAGLSLIRTSPVNAPPDSSLSKVLE